MFFCLYNFFILSYPSVIDFSLFPLTSLKKIAIVPVAHKIPETKKKKQHKEINDASWNSLDENREDTTKQNKKQTKKKTLRYCVRMWKSLTISSQLKLKKTWRKVNNKKKEKEWRKKRFQLQARGKRRKGEDLFLVWGIFHNAFFDDWVFVLFEDFN